MRASHILSFEGSHKLTKILHFVQDRLSMNLVKCFLKNISCCRLTHFLQCDVGQV
jgi:hypothetical protein